MSLISKILSNTLFRTAAKATAYIGAGYITSGLISSAGEERRAYYGDREYENRFGGQYERMAGLSKLVGFGLGASSLIGYDPVSAVRAVGKLPKTLPSYLRASSEYKLGLRYLEDGSYKNAARMWNKFNYLPRNKVELRAGAGKRVNETARAMSPLRGLIGLGAMAGVLGVAAGAPAQSLASMVGTGALVGGYIARKHLGAVALGSASLIGGAAVGMTRPPYPAAEGNITDVQYSQESTVRKLNYNTSGLVQALHNNRVMR